MVIVNSTDPLPIEPSADPGYLPVLYRDEHLVVIHKPAGWLVHRTGLDAGETRFVVQTLRDQLGQRVFPVHRLDKGTQIQPASATLVRPKKTSEGVRKL